MERTALYIEPRNEKVYDLTPRVASSSNARIPLELPD